MSYRHRAQSQPQGFFKLPCCSINAYFSNGGRPRDELAKMAACQDNGNNAAAATQASLQPVFFPIESPYMVSDTAAPVSPGSSASHDRGFDMSELHRELQRVSSHVHKHHSPTDEPVQHNMKIALMFGDCYMALYNLDPNASPADIVQKQARIEAYLSSSGLPNLTLKQQPDRVVGYSKVTS